jgi:cobyrinic acid a,c-diamide synthase
MQSATVSCISPVVDRSELEIVAAVDAVTVLLEKSVGRGYTWEKVVTPTQVAPVGAEWKSHERHYSIGRNLRWLLSLRGRVGAGGGRNSVVKNNIRAQHLHIHPYAYNVFRTLRRFT